jgi:hypothetical protein
MRNVVEVRQHKQELAYRCSACGADRGCDCNAPAIKKAAAALAANPEKSNRAIAKDIGVSPKTVDRARQSTASHDAVEKRIGLDGKARKRPAKRAEAKRAGPEDTPTAEVAGNGSDPETSAARRKAEYAALDADADQQDHDDDAAHAAVAAVRERNIRIWVDRSHAGAKALRKVIKVAHLEDGARREIDDAIERLIREWRTVQSALRRSAERPPDSAVEKRIGLDGKARRAPQSPANKPGAA